MLFKNAYTIMPSCRQSKWPKVQPLLALYMTDPRQLVETIECSNDVDASSLLSRSISLTPRSSVSVRHMFASLTSKCAMLKLSCSSWMASHTSFTNLLVFSFACLGFNGGFRRGYWKKEMRALTTFLTHQGISSCWVWGYTRVDGGAYSPR